ncbi:MAG TPA: MmcQ/YjbR family DNA-binding protein [Longimicrobiaceae bacterium]|nr:MmcQ/YjbR family DNA-binding protein [Longimicrobiaceae bacterium]
MSGGTPMDFRTLRDHCLGKPGATEDFPFGEEVLVFRVMGKIFALTNVERLPLTVNLKCDPELAVELRDRWPAVQPGYHMNKAHWNTVELDGSIPAANVREMVDHSYARVVAGLKRAERERLARLTRDPG